MREFRTSGSVGASGSNPWGDPTTSDVPGRRAGPYLTDRGDARAATANPTRIAVNESLRGEPRERISNMLGGALDYRIARGDRVNG
jgi:hypothetical protein